MSAESSLCACGTGDSPSADAKDHAHLHAIRHYAELATTFAETWTSDSDEPDRVGFLAISSCLGTIGGAACNLSAEAVPDLGKGQWPRVMALHQRMREYWSVTPSLVQSTVQNDLPPLIAALGTIKAGKGQ